MLFNTFVLVFPMATLASWLPVLPRADNCTVTNTLPPVTLTSVYPTSTIGGAGQGHNAGSGTIIYTTALPTLGPGGPNLHTYTVTATCPSRDCHVPHKTELPFGFTTTAVICNVCGEHAMVTVLTLPSETATAVQGSAFDSSYTNRQDEGEHVIKTCKDGSCAHVSAPTSSTLVESVRLTSPKNVNPTGSSSYYSKVSSQDSKPAPLSTISPSQETATPGKSFIYSEDAEASNTSRATGSPESTGSATFPSSSDSFVAHVDGTSRVETATGKATTAGTLNSAPSSEPTVVQVVGSASGIRVDGKVFLGFLAIFAIWRAPLYGN